MADSEQARFTTFEVPGLMMTPIPHGGISAADRAQLNDHYAGILAAVPTSSNQTCWTPSLRNDSVWVNSKKSTNTWIKEKGETKTWIPEKEMVPC